MITTESPETLLAVGEVWGVLLPNGKDHAIFQHIKTLTSPLNVVMEALATF